MECEHLDIDPYKSHYAGIVCETEAKGIISCIIHIRMSCKYPMHSIHIAP